MSKNTVEIKIWAKDQASKALGAVRSGLRATAQGALGLGKALTSLKGLLVAYGGLKVAGSFVETASAFEDMRAKLDAITKGRGAETLERLNSWALTMPVNTRKAVEVFGMMQATGLSPTIDKMQTLVDVSSVLGEETLERVARALGQMQSSGKLSAEELNQLAEAGINARKYLKDAFGQTVEDIQKTKRPVEEIIQAIWQGLDRDFGGSARRAQSTWRGMVTALVSYWDEFKRAVMDSGVFVYLKAGLSFVLDRIEEARRSGEFTKWAEDAGNTIVSLMEKAVGLAVSLYYWLKDAFGFLSDIIKEYTKDYQLTAGMADLFRLLSGDETSDDEVKRKIRERVQAIKDALKDAASSGGKTGATNTAPPATQGMTEGALKIRKAVYARMRAELENNYKQGGKALQEYFDERRKLVLKNFSAELATLEKGSADYIAKKEEKKAALIKLEGEYYDAKDRLRKADQKAADKAADKEALDEEKRKEAYISGLQQMAGEFQSLWSDLYAASGEQVKEFFYLMKSAAIAEAIISTYVAANKAMEQGGIMGMILAGVVTAAGMARVAAISATMASFAEGGVIGGRSPTSTADNIPIWATAGEGVLPNSAMAYYGPDIFEAIRRAAIPRAALAAYVSGALPAYRPVAPRFAEGGLVGQLQGGSGERPLELTVIQVSSREEMLSAMASSRGRAITLGNLGADKRKVLKILGGGR